MNSIKLLLIFLLIFPFSVYGEGNNDHLLSIQYAEDKNDDYAFLSSNECNDHVIHLIKSFQLLALENSLKGDFLYSPIYLIKRFELLMVIKFNTSFYAHFF
ncbi:MAG: hypothetical protein ACK4M9_07390 [Anaerobacillus sp.]|uniref:hypothetical protein n=1 Tax=Anaerobacillus sp. TaxID=1872506 RepID=UPI00391898F1